MMNLPVDGSRCAIFGHSMGGHGALTLALKNPDTFRSVSAFAPICAPMQCPWGQKAFGGYFGGSAELAAAHIEIRTGDAALEVVLGEVTHLEVRAAGFYDRAQDITADSAESVNCDFNAHFSSQFFRLIL